MIHNVRSELRTMTVGRAVVLLVLLALIAPFVVYAVPATVGGEASYIVLTASMTPAIAPGDVIIVDDVPGRDIAVNDVIVFEQQAGDRVPVTHRVIGVDRAENGALAFRTKGDANEDADMTPVTPDRLIGRVLVTVPLIGYVIQFVGTPAGFVALVVLPFGLLIASEVVDLLRSGRSPDAPASAGDDSTGDDGDGGAPVTDHATDSFAGAAIDESTASDPDQFTISPTDLTVASVVLGAFGAYAAYAAYQNPTGVSVALAVAVVAAFALAVGVRTVATSTPVATDGGVAGGAAVPEVRIDHGPNGPTVTVESPADLRAIAGAVGRPTLVDGDRYVVLDGAVTYACAIPDDPRTADGPRPDDTASSSDAESGDDPATDGEDADAADLPSAVPDAGGVRR